MILPVMVLYGAYVGVTSLGRKMAGAAIAAQGVSGVKSGMEVEALRKAEKMRLPSEGKGRLVVFELAPESFPPEYRYCAYRYLLTDEEILTLSRALEVTINGQVIDYGAGPVQIDLPKLVQTLKAATDARNEHFNR